MEAIAAAASYVGTALTTAAAGSTLSAAQTLTVLAVNMAASAALQPASPAIEAPAGPPWSAYQEDNDMTALNLWVQPGAAHIVTDAASYDPDGSLIAIGSKVITFPTLKIALAGRGMVDAFRVRELLDARPPSSQAEVLEIMAPACRALWEANNYRLNPQGAGQPINHLGLTAIWWDEAEGRAKAANVGSGGDTLVQASMAPFTLYRGGGSWVMPAFEGGNDLDWGSLDPDVDGARILEAQRAEMFDLGSGVKRHTVGGFGEAVTVTREGLRQRRLIEWPEDVVGSVVMPVGSPAFAAAGGGQANDR